MFGVLQLAPTKLGRRKAQSHLSFRFWEPTSMQPSRSEKNCESHLPDKSLRPTGSRLRLGLSRVGAGGGSFLFERQRCFECFTEFYSFLECIFESLAEFRKGIGKRSL